MYGRQYQKGLNIVTTVAMIGFRADAIPALFLKEALYVRRPHRRSTSASEHPVAVGAAGR